MGLDDLKQGYAYGLYDTGFSFIFGGNLMGWWGIWLFFAFLCTGRRRHLGAKGRGNIGREKENVTKIRSFT